MVGAPPRSALTDVGVWLTGGAARYRLPPSPRATEPGAAAVIHVCRSVHLENLSAQDVVV